MTYTSNDVVFQLFLRFLTEGKSFSKKSKKRVDTPGSTCYNSFLSGATDTDKFPDANVAQSVEQLIRNQQVRGSNPLISSKRDLSW